MSKTLQYGLYELCRMRIEQDEEFRAQSARGDLSVVDDELFDEYRLWQLKKTVKLVKENSAFYGRLYAKYNVGAEDIGSLSDIQKLPVHHAEGPFRYELQLSLYLAGRSGKAGDIFLLRIDRYEKAYLFLPTRYTENIRVSPARHEHGR